MSLQRTNDSDDCYATNWRLQRHGSADSSQAYFCLTYLPIVPLIDISRDRGQPLLGPGIRLVATVLVVGAWGRVVGAALVAVGGASITFWDMLVLLLLPGAFVDLVLSSLVYAFCRTGFGEPERETWLTWS